MTPSIPENLFVGAGDGCGYFTVNRTELLRTVDFPTVGFFSYFSKFFVVFLFQEIFSEKKNFEKKKTEKF